MLGFGVVDELVWVSLDLSLNMSLKKLKSACSFASPICKKAPQKKKLGEKFSNWDCCVGVKGSCFSQENLLALDKEDV